MYKIYIKTNNLKANGIEGSNYPRDNKLQLLIDILLVYVKLIIYAHIQKQLNKNIH